MTLTDQARDFAKQLFQEGETDETKMKKQIAEKLDCGVTTAWRGIKRAKEELEKGLRKAIEPRREIAEEPEKKPAYVSEKEEGIQKVTALEEIAPTEPTRAIKPEEAEQIEAFRDMLRGTHILFMSKEGLLGQKYGHSKEVCIQTSDQFYRWLTRRYGVEELEKFDTILLFMAYANFVGNPVLIYVRERQRKAEEEKKKPKEKET